MVDYDSELSGLPAVLAVGPTDQVYVVQGGVSKKGTVPQIGRFVTERVNVRDFGLIADGASHPLSGQFANLAAAQVEYPSATSLTNEIDRMAWEKASQYVYDRDFTVGDIYNKSTAHFIYSGICVFDDTLALNHLTCIVEGANKPGRFALPGTCGFKWSATAAAGTVDLPKPLIDFYLFTEDGTAPPGKLGGEFGSGGGMLICNNSLFYGQGGSMTANSPSVSNYLSGMRLRKGTFCRIHDCVFSGTLYDGIYTTAPQLFFEWYNNWFYGVHRDAVAILACFGNFSTTLWSRNNEYGYVGRYAILMDLSGSTEAKPIIKDESVESSYASYFVNNPEWFVQGIPSPTCFINCGNIDISNVRVEAATDVVPGLWADAHLVDCAYPVIEKGVIRNIAFSTRDGSDPKTAAAVTYLAANKYLDVTNQRNFNAGSAGDNVGNNQNVTIKNMMNLCKLFQVNGAGLTTSSLHSMYDCVTTLLDIPTVAGTYATIAQPRQTALCTLAAGTGNWRYFNSAIFSTAGMFGHSQFDEITASGYLYLIGGSFVGHWAASTAYVTTMTGNATLDSLKIPLTENGFVYQCIVAGTSGGSEPTFPTVIGNTVVDGGVLTWKCVGRCAMAAENLIGERRDFGIRVRYGSGIPAAGNFVTGDRLYLSQPAAGGVMGYVCTSGAGVGVGTWKAFGSVAA